MMPRVLALVLLAAVLVAAEVLALELVAAVLPAAEVRLEVFSVELLRRPLELTFPRFLRRLRST